MFSSDPDPVLALLSPRRVLFMAINLLKTEFPKNLPVAIRTPSSMLGIADADS
jgi:hypothetical protein